MRDLGSVRSGFSVGGRMLNAKVGPSAAYGLGRLRGGCAADWVVGCMAERVAEGGGDVVSYLVHWSRAARPKLLQHRGCHKAAVMTEFTATARRFTPSHRRSKTLAACGDAVARHD